MAITSQDILPRWQRKLRSAEFLWIDLDDIGVHVGPRTGPAKRDADQRNDYVLRRLLVAMTARSELAFPAECIASPDLKEYPDFLLRSADGRSLGVEVTEAGAESWQAALTHAERGGRGASESIDSDRAVRDLKAAIDAKVSKRRKGWYGHAPECDLAVYDNAEGTGFLAKPQLIEQLGGANEWGVFRQIHLVSGGAVYLDIMTRPLCSVWIADRYEVDFFRWTESQAEALRERRWGDLDIEHLAEEVESMGRRDRRSFFSQLERLMTHLLKWQYQPSGRGRSWERSIFQARIQLLDLEEDSPSLAGEGIDAAQDFEERFERSYARARRTASTETKLSLATLPDRCPYTMEELRDDSFLPGE